MVTTTVPNDACVSHPPKLVSFYRYWSYLIVSMFDKLIGAYSKYNVRNGCLVLWKCPERAKSPLPYTNKGGPCLWDEGKILLVREDIKATKVSLLLLTQWPGFDSRCSQKFSLAKFILEIAKKLMSLSSWQRLFCQLCAYLACFAPSCTAKHQFFSGK